MRESSLYEEGEEKTYSHELFFQVARVVLSIVFLPERFGSHAVLQVRIGFVPKHAILDSIRSGPVVEDHAPVPFRTLVKDSIEHFERRNDPEEVFVNAFAILDGRFLEEKGVVDVSA